MFGLFTGARELPSGDVLTVFPELLPLAELKLEAEDPFGDRRTRRRLYEDPNLPMGVRDYRPEDGFRRIHWPATARIGMPQSKVYQSVSARVLMVCLNVSTLERYWEGVLPDLLERLVRVAATLLYHAYEAGYAVGLLSNGCLAHSDQPFRLPPGRSAEHLAATLSLLAGVTPFTTGPFAQYLTRSMTEVPFGATVVVVTAVVPAELNETLVSLKRYRRNITLVSLAPAPPREIPGIRNVHLPFRP